jgi:starch-binding outer membrane protein, SusD/RagB family
MANADRNRGRSRIYSLLTVIASGAFVWGCDFSVTNPGPVQDQYLDDPRAHAALVNGAAREFMEALNFMALTTGGVTREIHAGGNVCNFGITALQTIGILGDDEWENSCSPIWGTGHRARWVADDGVRRLRGVLQQEFASSRPAADLLLLVGYSNRLLGENMCSAVIDGGPAQPYTVHLTRAEAAFTEAIEIGERLGAAQVATAARAGRASVRVGLGNWNGAVQDAQGIPDSFVHQVVYNGTEIPQNNRIWRGNSNAPTRTHTVWNTVYEQYTPASGDPRTRWERNPQVPVGDAAVGAYGHVPWLFQLKYDRAASPINLSSGWEMRLIEVEAMLRDEKWEEAMAHMNRRRVQLGIDPWVATSANEAWTHFKRERGIELWLEARRLGDLRRWKEEGTPGNLHPLEVQGGIIPLSPNRSYCAPIPQAERRTNANIS